MASDSEGEEYVYYGTPLEQEKSCPYYAKPSGADHAAKTVALPVHQQQVRDEHGRQRLHGAFTGGFSAGYYNTVGSAEGWAPSTFKSSRDKRIESTQQQAVDFMDDDERAELDARGLQATNPYDTFAATATAAAQGKAEAEAARRHGQAAASLNLFPAEALTASHLSIGMSLLQKMGWRPGQGVGASHEAQALARMGYSVAAVPVAAPAKPRKWETAGMSGARRPNTPIHVLQPKGDRYGLGYDPYRNADEFRLARKAMRDGSHAVGPSAGPRQRGLAFTPSVLEAGDTMEGELADYADDGVGLLAYHNEVASSDDEAGDPAATLRADGRLQGGRGVAGLVRARQGTMGNESFIEGFVRGEMDREGDIPAQPAAPRGGGPPHGQHAFARPCARWYGAPRARDDAAADDAEDGAAAAEPPSDASLKARIDMHAAMVARGGDDVAELARRTHAGDSDYDFLEGGLGATYFAQRVAIIRRALSKAGAALQNATWHPSQPQSLSLEQRAAMLGEKVLPGTRKAAAHAARAAEAQQQQTQQAAADRAQSKAAVMQRAAAAGIVGSAQGLSSRFVKAEKLEPETGGVTSGKSAAEAQAPQRATAKDPVRTQRNWAPDPLLCKRFNVPDPYKGKGLPSKPEGAAGQPEYLAVAPDQRGAAYAAALPAAMRPAGAAPPDGFSSEGLPLPPPPGAVAAAAAAAVAGPKRDATDALLDELVSAAQAAPQAAEERARAVSSVEAAADAVAEAVPEEKPMDLFKAIFEASEAEESSDSSEDEESGAAGGSSAALRPGPQGELHRRSEPTAAQAGTRPPQRESEPASADAAPDRPPVARGSAASPPQRSSPALGDARRNEHSDAHQFMRPERQRSGSPRRSYKHRGDSAGRSSDGGASDGVRGRRERRRHRKSDKKRRRREERSEELVQAALDTVRRDVREQNMTTEELVAMARALKKRSRHRGERSGSDGSDSESSGGRRRRKRDKKDRKEHKKRKHKRHKDDK